MELKQLKWPEVAALSPDSPVVIPVAALEQHGPHLPLFTDSLLLREIIRRARMRLEDRVLFAPLMWLGNSDHHLDFPGTLSAPPRLYLDLLVSLGETFFKHGFRRIVFVNGHGGNDVPGKQAVFELRQRHRDTPQILFLFATYWSLGAKPWESDATLHQWEMGHACEWETSMILRLDPSLVGDYLGLPATDMSSSFAPATRGWTTKDRSLSGYIGTPHLATAEKGETLFRVFADDVAAFLERVIGWDPAAPW